MSTRAARSRLAVAMRGHVDRRIASLAKGAHYAVVRQLDPLQVELEDSRLILDEDDLVVTQWVRRYGYDFGLNVGDTVLVSHMSNDDFVVHDVVTPTDIPGGPASSEAATVSFTSRNGHIVRQVPFYGPTGVVVGYVPVYTSLSSDGAPT